MLLFIILTAASCNPTKYVPSGDVLLNKNNLIIERTDEPLPPTVTKAAMKPYIKQQPNKKIFGTRFHLGLYNLSDIEKEKWPHGWLRKIGEEPVIFDPVSATRSSEQIKSYLWSKGFFNASVSDTVRTEKGEAIVYFDVVPGKPYTIADIRYEIQDSMLYGLVIMDTINCMFKKGMIYDVDQLQNERQRVERNIRNVGFYGFSTQDIYFRIDSSLMSRQVIVYYVVARKSSLDSQGRLVYTNHNMYRIRDVYVFPEFDPKLTLTDGETYTRTFDTTYYKGIYYVAPPGRTLIKPEVINQSLYVSPGALFSLPKSEQTQARLLDMKNHRLVNITYVDAGRSPDPDRIESLLDCIIQLTPMQRQSFTVELEGTSTGVNLGGALNFLYQNKSLFRGAELFNMKLKGAYERVNIKEFKNTYEAGIETSLRLPKLLVPFPVRESVIRNRDPKTVLQAGYNRQSVPVYTRTIANVTAGYAWKGSIWTKHSFNPLSFDVVRLPFVDSTFQAMVKATSYLAYSFRPVMVLGGTYDFTFNNQMRQNSRRYWVIRCGFDVAGNFLNLTYNLAGAEKATDSTYHFLGQPFAQFVKGEIDASYHYKFNEASSIVYRFFAGVGWPYGNTWKAMPFEEQYFGGGSNDIRAWGVRTLGPGSYVLAEDALVNQTADIKLIGNVEYRFKLFWILEGAIFLDVGNIWTSQYDKDREEGQFQFSSFLDDLAVGTGVGLRFDLKFVLLRADLGLKLRDPALLTGGTKWVPFSGEYSNKDDEKKVWQVVIGIGYPF